MDKYNKLFGDYNPLILDKEQQALLQALQAETFQECLDEYEPIKISDLKEVDADWNSNDEKIQRHLRSTPQLFDLLTDEQKDNDAFVNAYRVGRFHQVNRGMEGNSLPNGKIVSTYWYSPECTKFYSVEGYQAAMESILNHPINTNLSSYTDRIIEYEKIPAEVVYVATMRIEHPELARELDKAERRAFENIYHQTAKFLWDGIAEVELGSLHYADVVDEKISEFIEQKSKIQPVKIDNSQLFANMNMYVLTKPQIDTIRQIQLENSYQNASEIISITPPDGHQQYNSAAEVIKALDENKIDSCYIWGNLSPKLRENKDEMMLLTGLYPGALFQASKSVLTVGYLKNAILNNPHVYDILPPFLKTEDSIVDTYRMSLLSQNDWPKYHLEICPDYAVQEFNPSPDCPKDKLYSPEAYKDVFECILTHYNMPIAECLPMPNYPNEIGAALTYVANARTLFPELEQEFNNAEIEAFYNVQENLIERYSSLQYDTTYICDFLSHHDIDFTNWLKRVQDNLCQNIAREISNFKEAGFYVESQIMHDVKTLMDRVPYYDIQEQFDLEEFWAKCGECSVEDESLYEEFNNLMYENNSINSFVRKHFEKGRDLAIEKQQKIDIERP